MSTAPARRARPPLPLPLQNGAEGDDEREEEVDEEEVGDDEAEEEEDDDDEEEEPRLKYQRLGGSVPAILSTDAAAAIAVADRMVALGTHNGTLHILDFQGNQVPFSSRHRALSPCGIGACDGNGRRCGVEGDGILGHWDCSRSFFLYTCWVKTTFATSTIEFGRIY